MLASGINGKPVGPAPADPFDGAAAQPVLGKPWSSRSINLLVVGAPSDVVYTNWEYSIYCGLVGSVLAEAAGVSPCRLERLFTRDLGVPPGGYALSRRVAGAAARIEAGAGLADAALASGFCDQSHLTRHFRRRMGVPPGKYVVEGE